jgi:hypothetical protein
VDEIETNSAKILGSDVSMSEPGFSPAARKRPVLRAASGVASPAPRNHEANAQHLELAALWSVNSAGDDAASPVGCANSVSALIFGGFWRGRKDFGGVVKKVPRACARYQNSGRGASPPVAASGTRLQR